MVTSASFSIKKLQCVTHSARPINVSLSWKLIYVQILKFDSFKARKARMITQTENFFRATDKSLLYRDGLEIGTKQGCGFDHKLHCTHFTIEGFFAICLFLTGEYVQDFTKISDKGQ